MLWGVTVWCACHATVAGQGLATPGAAALAPPVMTDSVPGIPAGPEVRFGIQEAPPLVRLPVTTPTGVPSVEPFLGWHRADLKLARDHEDDSDWGTGADIELPPWQLLPTSATGWSLSGLVNAGGTINAAGPENRMNGPLAFNDRDDFQLNQLYLMLQRAPSCDEVGLTWGGRVDLLWGTDYIFVQSAGWETQPDDDNRLNGETAGGNPNLYGLAVPQAYLDLSFNQFDLMLGHFYTILGYERVEASRNFFASHAYAQQYGEPLTHTGGMLRWQGQQLTVHAGVVNGWNQTDGVDDEAAFLGGVTVAGCRSFLSLSVISGEAEGLTTAGQRTMYSLVWEATLTDRFVYVLLHDLGYQQDAIQANEDATWYGVTQYGFFKLTDQWRVGARYEWFRDNDGSRLARMYIRRGGLGLPPAGFAGTYQSATLGGNWTPNPNLTVRPEIRWDWSSDTGIAPFDDLSSDSQLTVAIDAVYIF